MPTLVQGMMRTLSSITLTRNIQTFLSKKKIPLKAHFDSKSNYVSYFTRTYRTGQDKSRQK